MRPAAKILLVEGPALRPILEGLPPDAFTLPTVCAPWSVRDVLAHCAAALTAAADGAVHRFTPADNQADVDQRAAWPLAAVLQELWDGYERGAAAIDAAGGILDGIGIGEWMHGGDVREAVGVPAAYVSEGSDLALDLLLERSRRLEKPGVVAHVDGRPHHFGVGEPTAHLVTDLETFVRLTGGRNPDPARFRLGGIAAGDVVLFG